MVHAYAPMSQCRLFRKKVNGTGGTSEPVFMVSEGGATRSEPPPRISSLNARRVLDEKTPQDLVFGYEVKYPAAVAPHQNAPRTKRSGNSRLNLCAERFVFFEKNANLIAAGDGVIGHREN